MLELRYLYRLYNELDEVYNDNKKPEGYRKCVKLAMDELIKKIVEIEMSNVRG